MGIFFTGCTHFDHENIIRLAKRPFANIDDMNDTLVRHWNSRVTKDDTVFHLGDFTFGSHRGKWLSKLKGKVIFIQGNHDPLGWGVPYQELRHEGRKIIMSHYPFEEWDGWWHGSLHLHAHTHRPDFASAPRRFNVGVDACEFAPVSLAEILAHENARFDRADLPV